jgi:hypothetical protein
MDQILPKNCNVSYVYQLPLISVEGVGDIACEWRAGGGADRPTGKLPVKDTSI